MSTYRSWVFSVLKVQYGWDGFVPDGCDYDQWENIIEYWAVSLDSANATARFIADDIYQNGGVFRARVDGKPNVLVPTNYKEAGANTEVKHGRWSLFVVRVKSALDRFLSTSIQDFK